MKYRHTFTVMYNISVDIDTDERNPEEVPAVQIEAAAQQAVKGAEFEDIEAVESYNNTTGEYFNPDDEEEDDTDDLADEDDLDDDDEEVEAAPDTACFKFEPTDAYGTPIPGVPEQRMSLIEFMADNQGADDAVEAMRSLAVTETTMIGGGAAQGFRITRES